MGSLRFTPERRLIRAFSIKFKAHCSISPRGLAINYLHCASATATQQKIIALSPRHLSREEYTVASIIRIGVELAAAEAIRFGDYCRRCYTRKWAQRHVPGYRKRPIIEANYPHQEGRPDAPS